jgi:hypothetical protein
MKFPRTRTLWWIVACIAIVPLSLWTVYLGTIFWLYCNAYTPARAWLVLAASLLAYFLLLYIVTCRAPEGVLKPIRRFFRIS